MRYAIISDLHANLQAWNAVFLDLRSHAVDQIICLGDIIGYGPHPAEVLEAVHAHVHHFVLGNHEAAICGKLDTTLFNPGARENLRWTRERLGRAALRFLGTFPLTLDGTTFRCAHGDYSEPAAFRYVIEPEDALATWQAVDTPLLFVGHTHQPALWLLGASGIPRRVEPQDFELEPDKRFLVNVGSVGQPRDGDARACYCLWDTEARAVFWRRVPFDLDAYRAAVRKAGLSEELSHFLRHDPRLGVPPLRTMLSFAPPANAAQGARDVVAVQELTALRRTARRWRRRFVALLVLLALLVAAGTFAAYRHATRRLVVRDPAWVSISAVNAPADANLLPPLQAPADGGCWVPGWTVELGNRYRQTFTFSRSTGGQPCLRVTSRSAKDEVRLDSPEVFVRPGMKLAVAALVREEPGFAGNVAVVVSLNKKVGNSYETVDQFQVKEPNESLPDGWRRARKTFLLPAGAEAVTVQMRARGIGVFEIGSVTLERR